MLLNSVNPLWFTYEVNKITIKLGRLYLIPVYKGFGLLLRLLEKKQWQKVVRFFQD